MRSITLLLFLLHCCCHLHAREGQWLFYAGAGNSFGTSKGNVYTETVSWEVVNDFKVLPAAGIAWIHPIKGRFSIEAGVNYTRKTFRTKQNLHFIVNNHTREVLFDTRHKLGYLGFPLLLSYTVLSTAHSQWNLSAGMQYSFLLQGKTDVYSIQSTQGQDPDEYYFNNNKLRKALLQTKNTANGTANIFDTAIKLQLGYTWRNRIAVRMYHEQSLYSIYLKEPGKNISVKLGHTGLGIGVLL